MLEDYNVGFLPRFMMYLIMFDQPFCRFYVVSGCGSGPVWGWPQAGDRARGWRNWGNEGPGARPGPVDDGRQVPVDRHESEGR
jgi:hypothetical protein